MEEHIATLKWVYEKEIDYKKMEELYPEIYVLGLLPQFSKKQLLKVINKEQANLILRECTYDTSHYKVKLKRKNGDIKRKTVIKKMSKQTVVEKSQEKRLEALLNQFEFLTETIDEYTLLLNKVENEVISLFETLNTNKRGRVRLTYKKALNLSSIKELKSKFNNGDGELFNSLIVNLDIDKSVEALKYEVNVPEPIVKAFELKLKNLKELKVPKLTLERKIDDE